MKTLKYLSIATLSMMLVACSSNTEEPTTTTEEAPEQACSFSYDAASTSVNWTAYKLSSKDGVKAKFDSVVVEGVNVSAVAEDVMVGANFTIYTNSTNSGDPERDPKIINSFFNMMKEAGTITGEVLELKNGNGKVSLTMNGATLEVPVNYELNDNEFRMRTTINVPEWGAQNALDELNKVCSVRHTGPDGVKKLWPDVDVVVVTTLKKTCE
jgi:polyisoprenoid-binding protein YceI